MAGDQSVAFGIAQGLGEHALGNAADCASKLAEAVWSRREGHDQEYAPIHVFDVYAGRIAYRIRGSLCRIRRIYFRPSNDAERSFHRLFRSVYLMKFAEAWTVQWRAFLGRDRMAAAPDAFAAIVADLRLFLMPLVVGSKDERIWPPSGPWSPGAPIDEA